MTLKSKILILLALSALSACASHTDYVVTPDAPGFWSGLLHGFGFIFAFVASFFGDIQIYSVPNNGHWYDGGFVLGIMVWFGFIGGSQGSKD